MRVPCCCVALLVAGIAGGIGCASPLGPQYEYEEQLYLQVDGSATVVIDSSMAAFVALRDLPVSTNFEDLVDRDLVRETFVDAGCEDVRVGQPWVRRGRRFVQVRVSVDHVSSLVDCGPLAWSSYELVPEGDRLRYRQRVGLSSGELPEDVNWTGSELVAFKVHVPSRIEFHNVRRLEDGLAGGPSRGNILTWEQRLVDRLEGQTVTMDVLMDSDSILYRTLWLFGGAFGAALLLIAVLVWMVIRRARRVGHAPV